MCLDVSGTGMSLLMYATRERERILDLFEMVCGARLTVSYIRVGGVWKDLPPAFLTHLADFVRVMPDKIDDYEKMLTEAPLWDVRLKGIGKLTRDEAINMGLTGPMLRGRAWTGICAAICPTAATRTTTSRCRSPPTATATPATWCAWRKCARACASSSRP